MEWDGTRSDDGGGAGGVALDWVFTVEGSARVRVCRDGWGVMWGGRNELGWVRIGESLTGNQSLQKGGGVTSRFISNSSCNQLFHVSG